MSYNPKISRTKDNTISISGSLYISGTITGNVNLSVDTLEVSEINSNTLNVLTGIELDSKPKTSIRNVSIDTNLTSNDNIVLVNANNADINIYLPFSAITGQECILKKNDTTSNIIYIKPGFKEQAILSGSKAIQSGDRFGNSVVLNSSGDIAVIGASNDESGSSGSSGLAYVFTNSSAGWTESAILSGSKAIDASDFFGVSVAVNSTGNIIAIAAIYDESGSTTSTGLAYVFSSGSTGWRESAILSGSKAIETNDYFGYSVAVNSTGDKIIVGAYTDESGSTLGTGLAYVFSSGSTGWTETAILSGSKAIQASDYFGYSVTLNSTGNIAVIGAINDGYRSTSGTGLVYVFSSGSTGWTETAVLSGSKAIDASDNFGYSVAVNSTGDKIIVGAYTDEPGATTSTGLAYVFGYQNVKIDNNSVYLLTSSYEKVKLIYDGTDWIKI